MLGHSPVPNRGYGTSSNTNEAGGLEHAAAGKVWAQNCGVVIRVRGSADAQCSDTFVHGTCSFYLHRHMALLSQGSARACLSEPTAAHWHDRHSLQEAAPEHQRERPKVIWPRSCELSIPSSLTSAQCVHVHPDVRIQIHCSGAEVMLTQHLLFCYGSSSFESHWRE